MCLDPFEGDRGRLLHHVAQIAREAQAALAGREHRLDVEDVAAHFRPGEARHHADDAAHLVLLVEEFGFAEDLFDLFRAEFGCESLLRGDLLGPRTRQLGDVLVERPHARFAGVAGDDLFDDLRREDQLLLLDAVRLALFGQQVVQGDLDLVFEDVTRDVDHLHAVAQRRIDIADVVGRGDEEHLREVVLRIEVVVVERGVLFRDRVLRAVRSTDRRGSTR